MRGLNKPYVNTQRRLSLPTKRALTKKYLKMMRQREIDAMVEITRNQLMDRYDG
ncbi:MAG: hypothetical protein ISR86_12925 [Nitrospinaceae bacterium]|nr:hypothetical protein [Nitrospinaceae bacterium]